MKNLRTCGHPGCDRKHWGKGFCNMHYNRDRRGSGMDVPWHWHAESVRRTCSHPGCERKHSGKGFCLMHYTRDYMGKDMDAPKRGTV